MVSSPMYERLKVFMEAARSNRDLDAWDTDHTQTLKGLEESVERLKQYRDSQGFVGETAKAMNAWVDKAVARINGYKAYYQAGHTTYEGGRKAMATALKEAELLSPTLLDADTAAMRDNPVVMVPDSSPGGGVSVLGKRFTTGAAYVDAVEAQANAQREAAAQRVLDTVNSKTNFLATQMAIQAAVQTTVAQVEHPAPDVSRHETSTRRTREDDHSFGRHDDRSPSSPNYPGGFAQPWWSEADAAAAQNRTVASGAIPTQEPAYGETGSRTNPITNPQDLMGTDLLHTAVNGTAYRNGVVGGHTPAPPADVDHPLWRLNGGAASDSATAGRLGGAGVLGAGALGLRGAARMGSGSFGGSGAFGGSSVFGRFGGAGASGLGGSGSASGLSGAGRMGAGRMGAAGMRGMTGSTNGMGASGAAGLKVGSYSGSGFGSYTPPAGSAGAAGAGGPNGAAGSSAVTGTTGANGGGAAGAAGAAGKGGTTNGGFMGSGAGAGAGAGKDDKKGRKNRYVAFKFDDDEDELPAGYVNPLSQTSGTDKDIAPAKHADDGWDPRQW